MQKRCRKCQMQSHERMHEARRMKGTDTVGETIVISPRDGGAITEHRKFLLQCQRQRHPQVKTKTLLTAKLLRKYNTAPRRLQQFKCRPTVIMCKHSFPGILRIPLAQRGLAQAASNNATSPERPYQPAQEHHQISVTSHFSPTV